MLLIASMRRTVLGGVMISAIATVSAALERSQPVAAVAAVAVSWLDAPHIEPWSRPGVSIPMAPPGPKNTDPRCREYTRSPQSEEDRQLNARGWDLIGPSTVRGRIRVIGAAANYDGMCRPLQYQHFVFADAVFAGTLSPQPMDSRTDGALSRVAILSEGKLRAEYLRYSANDPLCCPSRTTTVAFDLGKDPPLLRPVSVTTVSNQTGRPP